jgi:signal transduction histidine kinase
VDGIIVDITWMVRLHEQLIRAEGQKTISEVSARLAHEIRNPLVSAGGFARRLLASMKDDDPNRSKVEIIVKEVARLEAVLRMILNYIQPLELDASPTDLNDLLTTTLKGMTKNLERHQVRLDLQLASDLSEISLDRKLLVQVLEALLRNALERMPKGAELTIQTSPRQDAHELCMRYPARDIRAEEAEHFFYPFSTSPPSSDEIDLPMCKIIIGKHGGAINVCVEAAEELVIRMSLPIQDDRSPKVHISDK